MIQGAWRITDPRSSIPDPQLICHNPEVLAIIK
jgi:hypothetical protein